MTNRFDGPGTWSALLTLGDPRTERSDSRDGTDPTIRYATPADPLPAGLSAAPVDRARRQRASILAAEHSGAGAPPSGGTADDRLVPYSVLVHTYSNLTFAAQADQDGHLPGTAVRLHAVLTQSGIPLAQLADVQADVTTPGGAFITIAMPETEDGRFAGQFDAVEIGVYRIRMRARGTTTSGYRFTRERTLTAAVWRGDDQPPTAR